ncbi:MAG TPA: AtzE family amidohydrolase [Devosia sp.]
MTPTATAVATAEAVREGRTTARVVVEAALKRIDRHNKALGAFTDVLADRALKQADTVDASVKAGTAGPLAGVPFAAKNLFDIAGIVTRAGSKLNRGNAPAAADATLVTRLEAAGAVLVGACNMDEYAYGFVGENAHDGPSCNPHDITRMTGGSSAGPAAAVAAGLVPLSLGSDTNGSIRVPASFCGLFGLKPTYGRLSRAGAYPFVASLDHVGPLARSVRDLALAYDVMQVFDEADPAQTKRPNEPVMSRLKHSIPGIRIAMADGYFAGEGLARDAVVHVAKALDGSRTVSIPDAHAARAAAFLITMAEGAALHLDRLRSAAEGFDPDVRDRLLAGTMLPGAWITRAQKLRRYFRETVLKLFETLDAILVPSTPMTAPLLGQKTGMFGGVEMPLRPHIGIYTQPFSFIGLPVVSVPVWLSDQPLPIGVQIIAPPWREDIALRIAQQLEAQGVVSAPVAKAFIEG